MSTSPLASSSVAATPRAALTEVVRAAALATPGVVAVPVDGARAVALDAQRYEVGVEIVARLVPLPALAEAIRERAGRAAERAGLGAELGDVRVRIVGVRAAEEETS